MLLVRQNYKNKLYHYTIHLYYNVVIMPKSPQKNAPDNLPVQGIQVIARAAAVLRVMKDDNEGLSLGQIAGRVGLARSTVQRIVNALVAERLVMSLPNKGGLRLGPEIQALAAASRLDIVTVTRPYLAGLSEKTGETVDLAAFRSDHMAFIDQIVGPHRLRAVATVGEAFPLTSTANGKACLALMDNETIETLATRELRSGGRGMRALAKFMRQIDQVRALGYATDIDEHTDGISAVGAAFTAPDSQHYAVSIPVPSHRFEKIRANITECLQATMAQMKASYSA